MNWGAVGAIGEVVGAVAVLITLIYLAAQIRQNTSSVRSNTAHSTNVELSDLFSLVSSSSEVALIFSEGLRDPRKLEASEQVRFNFLMHKIFINFEDSFHQHRRGHLEPELWHRIKAVVPWYAQHPGFTTWWNGERYIYSPSFREFVDAASTQPLDERAWYHPSAAGNP